MVLSIITNVQYLLPPSHNRMSILSCVLVSFMIAVQRILERTPRVVNGFHILLTYAYSCSLQVVVAFLEYCLLLYFQRIFPTYVTSKFFHTVDVIFFFLNAIVYTAFNVIFWVYNPFWPNSDVCHNEDRFDINCKT